MTETTPQLIGGRYETVRPIGRGGMGTVWLARDTVLGRQVAAKQIGDFPGESEGETRRAMREARAAAALNHPNVVAVHDRGVEQDRPRRRGGRGVELMPGTIVGETLSPQLRTSRARMPHDAAAEDSTRTSRRKAVTQSCH